MQTLLNTLYLTLPGYLHLDNDTLRFEVERETRLRVPLHHLGAVVCFGDVLVSPAAMARLANEGKTLVLLNAYGRFQARLEGAVSGNILLRQAQFRLADQPEFCLRQAKAMIAGKLKNSRYVLLRGARDSHQEADAEALRETAQALAASLRALESAPDLNTVRGLEGEAARRYFAAMGYLLRPELRRDFTPNGRSRRPPRDRMNALELDRIHMTSSNGTDLTVGLADDATWEGASSKTEDGIEFIANVPTEEVFCAPHRERTNGIVYGTKPYAYNGQLIEGWHVTFKDGVVVEHGAEKNADLLAELLSTDENSNRIGEIALVPASSPINRSGVLFYNTLFDENAACHIAFGAGYPTNIRGGSAMTRDDLMKKGLNNSAIHEDVMIGAADTHVTGITKRGEEGDRKSVV